ncbi:electron transfer flavoprotein subunit beta [Acetobacter aceti 1023]|nr:electron transfer flavoprotein subunit beta [Acetobacter aceti 1023]
MKILVPVKRVVDYNVRVRVRADGSGIETGNVKMSMNPFDEIALEEAVRLKEKGIATEVLAVSIGMPQTRDTLRTALAMGADRALLVALPQDAEQDLEPLCVARILAKIADSEKVDLVIAGKQAIDNDMNATGQMLAAALGWGQGTYASAVDVAEGSVQVTREVDGGLQTLRLKIPAVITTDLRLNQPRYVALPAIMKAKKKTIEDIPLETLGIDITPRLEILKTVEPPTRQAGVKVHSVDELLSKLKTEAGVL